MDESPFPHLPKKIWMKGAIVQEATGISAILAGTGSLTTLVGDVFNMITGNGLLVVFAAAGLIGVGIGIFRRLKRAAR